MDVTIRDLENYLSEHYEGWGIEQNMFMKLVEEVGEVAEVLNKKACIKASEEDDLQVQLGNELADVIHYVMAIAALNGLDMTEMILSKDKSASVRYHHKTNLENFILAQKAD